MTKKLLQQSCALLFLMTAVGCGSADGVDMGNVKGLVTLDGQPLPNATVMFQPTEGRPSLATTNDRGAFELKYSRDRVGALVGHHVVNIRTRQEDDNGKVVVKEFLPKRYHDQTELNAEVSPGENQCNFDLKSGG